MARQATEGAQTLVAETERRGLVADPAASQVERLRAGGEEREAASRELRELLVRATLTYLLRHQYPAHAFGADDYLSLAEDVAQEALAIILRQLDSFRGQGRFTTWCYRVVVNLIGDELRRRAWRRRPLEDVDAAGAERSARLDPEREAQREEVWNLVQQAIERELTPRQRAVLVGHALEGKPLAVLAEQLGADRGAVYKTLHDARKKLKRALLARGLSEAEALAAFG